MTEYKDIMSASERRMTITGCAFDILEGAGKTGRNKAEQEKGKQRRQRRQRRLNRMKENTWFGNMKTMGQADRRDALDRKEISQ